MSRVFVDTSAWYALIDRADPDHGLVARALHEFSRDLATSDYVVDETLTLLRYRLGHNPAVAFGDRVFGGGLATLLRTGQSEIRRGWDIFRGFDDQRFSFTDCISFALMERHKIVVAVALDSDFQTFGFRCIPAPGG